MSDESKMRLYHMAFCPFSRKIALGMREKELNFQETQEKFWQPSDDLLSLNPSGELPTLVDHTVVCVNEYVAWEYIEEAYPSSPLISSDPVQRAQMRSLISWFDRLFYQDVYLSLFYERALKPHIEHKGPDTQILKTGRVSLRNYLETLEKITSSHTYLLGRSFSWGDITAAAHLSCIDYLGDIPWDGFPFTKEWYSKIKSRPTFRPFLLQNVPGLAASPWYGALDF
jgi:glutathione S-transferase